jgi:hypothetical protein
MESLLLGNGINANSTKSTMFSTNEIKNRFLIAFDLFIEDIKQPDLFIKLSNAKDYLKNKTGNIEQITSIVFEYVKNSFLGGNGHFSGNHEQRLKRFLKKTALNAIFFNDGSFISNEIYPEIVSSVEKYENILTLNYFEYWDYTNKAKYLHRKAEFANNEVSNYDDCIFSPLLDKPKSISDALFPSNHLYPSDDLYPMGSYDLYNELNTVDYIEIFGVSPYGDDELLAKLRDIKRVIVYIYNNDVEQEKLWKHNIPHSVFKDYKEILT